MITLSENPSFEKEKNTIKNTAVKHSKHSTYSSEELLLNSDRSSSAEELEEFPYSSNESGKAQRNSNPGREGGGGGAGGGGGGGGGGAERKYEIADEDAEELIGKKGTALGTMDGLVADYQCVRKVSPIRIQT